MSFRFCQHWSGPIAGLRLRRLLGSEFQTARPAEAIEGATTEGAAADTWNSQLMAAGGLQVPATGNVGHWNAVVGEVRRCLIPETPVNGNGKLVLHSLRDVEPVQFIVK